MSYNSDNFNLTHWNLCIPVDSTGGTTGTAITISNLVNYESPQYFYDNVDGSMVFYAPVSGATTSGSYGARTELRELDSTGKLAAWNMSQGGTMTATLAVNTIPTFLTGTPGKVIIGQIHGKSNELCRLYYDNGTVYFKNDKSGSTNTEHKFLLTDAAGKTPHIALNEKFSYMIDAHGSTLTVKLYTANDVYTSVSSINSYWQTDTLYFKAGVYLGVTKTANVDLGQGTGAGQTTFYGLDMSHAQGQGIGGIQMPTAHGDSFTTDQDHAIAGNLLNDNGHGSDTGPAGLTLAVAAAKFTTSHGGSVVENADGTFTYAPATGYHGSDSFSYTLKDGAGLTSIGTVDITVNATTSTGSGGSGGTGTETGGTTTGGLIVNGTSGNDTLNADHDIGTTLYGLTGNDYLVGHDGNDTLVGGSGSDRLYGYWGNDVLIGGAGADTLSGSVGADTYVFKAADIGTGVDKILDFSTSQGDKIDIADVLSGHYNPLTSAIENFVHVTTSSGTSVLSVDLTGHGGAAGWTQVATITGTLSTDEALLVHDGTLIVG